MRRKDFNRLTAIGLKLDETIQLLKNTKQELKRIKNKEVIIYEQKNRVNY